jgi:uncharacterized HAD superfamily protein
MRIGVDIDGVMYKWDKTARYMLRDVLPNSPYKDSPLLKQEAQYWNWIPDQVKKEHWNWLWKEGVALGLFRYGHLYPGTIQAIRTLAARGHEVVLITHRPKSAVGDTLAWLGLLNLPIAGLHLLTNQESKALVQPQCDVYIDDKVENVRDLYEHTTARCVVLCQQPWNNTVEWEGARKATTRGWDEFLQVVEAVK